jgi:molybdate transport system ATP-binding protein
VLGNNGAGKSTFLRLVRGDLWPAPGCGRRAYRVNGRMQGGPIGFRESTGLVSSDLLDMYRTMEWNLTGMDVVCTGFDGTPLLSRRPDERRMERVRSLLEALRITSLSDRYILGMSQGEAKKILIARALVKSPAFLFLDEFDAGLDTRSQNMVMDLLHAVVEQGTHVLMAAHDANRVPSFVTHAVRLRSGCIANQGPMAASSTQTSPPLALSTRSDSMAAPEPRKKQATDDLPLIQIEHADVARHGNRVVRQITWTVKSGQNWALVGENGSGKTTLLKLVAGELRPVWGGKIARFGLDGSLTLWDLRRRISLVTPDMQVTHACGQTSLNVVLSGFYGSVGLHRRATEAQTAAARSWFERLGVQELEDRQVDTLSYGQQRAILVMRAVVTDPTVLLLDEVLSGLDAGARNQVTAIIEEFAGPDSAVLYVTHNQREISPFFGHVAVLEEGRLVFQGTREQWCGKDSPAHVCPVQGADGETQSPADAG